MVITSLNRIVKSQGIDNVYSENYTHKTITKKQFFSFKGFADAIDVTGNYDTFIVEDSDFYNYEYSGWGSGSGDRAIGIGGSVGNNLKIRKIILRRCRFIRCYKGVHVEYLENEEMLFEDFLWLNSKPQVQNSNNLPDARPLFFQNSEFVKVDVQNILSVDILKSCGGHDAFNVLDTRASNYFRAVGLIFISPNSLRSYPQNVGGCVVFGDIASAVEAKKAAENLMVHYSAFFEWCPYGCQLIDEHSVKSTGNSFSKNIVLLKTRNSAFVIGTTNNGRSQCFVQFDADLAFSNDFLFNACNDIKRYDNISNIIAVADGNITTDEKNQHNTTNSFKNFTLENYLTNLANNLPIRHLLG